MTNVVKIPRKKSSYKPLGRQRVFFLGYQYIGGHCNEELQSVYLKRGGLKQGIRTWSLITYGKYDEGSRIYSLELETCDDQGLPAMVNALHFEGRDYVSEEELRWMGWNGESNDPAEVISISQSLLD